MKTTLQLSEKRSGLLVVIALLFSVQAFSQVPKFLSPGKDAGYMGLWDVGFSAGTYHEKYNHRSSINNYSEERKTKGQFLNFHFQESMLSNYFWSHKPDKRFKVGIVEMFDLGVSSEKTRVTNNDPNSPVNEPQKKIGLVFNYEGGLGGVYKINDNNDVGLTYYLLSISTFNGGEKTRYVRFRYRYNHLMAELSALGRTAVDIKYLMEGAEDRSRTPYIGLTYTSWKTEPGQNTQPGGQNSQKEFFVYLSLGLIL